MKKRRRKKYKLFLMLFMLFCGLAMFQNYFQQPGSLQLEKSDPFADVIKYRPLIHDELAKYNLETHTTVLVALMQQESRGKGGDPMQSSESAGLARNTITDPKKSIQVGVKHFQRVLTYGNQKKVDFQTIIQSYNMGIGYIDFVAQHGGKHSEALAKEFSLQRVKEKPTIYTCGAIKIISAIHTVMVILPIAQR
ncbi:lysozyme family protein [Bacillus sp. ISL-7]|uniref:lysozyme family protein n=1 Tax=Bacillus sp. ISL-7 TaxID=2819136 RepID=UPI002034DB0C|nr:lysozyme family protein [Bacillus sp. ISL-7]